MTLEYLQDYWWVLISVLGGILVFMLFVQGGQSMIFQFRNSSERDYMIACMGSKWELTFTTLVVFGGAFFASFPLFYSTCFGGAYWLWILILFSFVLQAVSYEYRRKAGNIYGTRTYDVFLFVNGLVGCLLLGVAVSMFFFGASFSVGRGDLLDITSPVISRWAPTHGFEAIFNGRNLVLGVAVFFLARMQASLYVMNRAKENADLISRLKRQTFINGAIFVLFFVCFLVLVCTATGYAVTSENGHTVQVDAIPFHYWFSLLANWWILAILLAGVVLVLYGWGRACFDKKYCGGIWFTGIGTFLAVVALFFLAGFGDSAYLPSVTDPLSSLTIRNSSSSEFTLKTMAYVSIVVPFVLAYIAYVWRQMDKTAPETH